MKQKESNRNEKMDLIREAALLLVMLSHFWEMISESSPPQNEVLHSLVGMSGTVGVTLFFILSGYGIYCSLQKMEEKGRLSRKDFLKKRMLRILPEYEFALAAAVLFFLMSHPKEEWDATAILTHVFLIHNLFPQYSMAISTPLWAMGVIVHFYLIAIPLYRWMKKRGAVVLLLSMCFSMAFSFTVAKIIPADTPVLFLDFWEKRHLLGSVLDIFVMGMFIAWLSNRVDTEKINQAAAIVITAVLSASLVFVLHAGWQRMLMFSTPYYYSLLAFLLCAWAFFFSGIEIPPGEVLHRIFIFLSQYEYSAYLWHFTVGEVLLFFFRPQIKRITEVHPLILYPFFFAIAILWGMGMTILVAVFKRMLYDKSGFDGTRIKNHE